MNTYKNIIKELEKLKSDYFLLPIKIYNYDIEIIEQLQYMYMGFI